jgi:hypothetical protein
MTLQEFCDKYRINKRDMLNGTMVYETFLYMSAAVDMSELAMGHGTNEQDKEHIGEVTVNLFNRVNQMKLDFEKIE